MDPLKEVFREKGFALRDELKEFNKTFGKVQVDTVTAGQVTGGMRSIKSLLWETSLLDANEGIRFRGYSIPQLIKALPKAAGDTEPLPEGLFWLMLTGDIPTADQVSWLSTELSKRAKVDADVFKTIDAISTDTHPMTQLSIAVMALQKNSLFARKYDEGINKSDYWDPVYEDCLNLIATLPVVAAYIYRRLFKDGVSIDNDPNLDWAANYTQLLGFGDENFKRLMRLYLTIHADHEGGNASAHTVHLVGSTLSDPYLSFSAGLNALAGPLHGLANQEVVNWINELVANLGTRNPSKTQIEDYVNQTITNGQVVPGYGHAVLRVPDPRFVEQRRFAEQYLADDENVQIVWKLFEVVPEVLGGLGKVANPWPNVDAHSGAILIHYGLTQSNYYTVLFGVSRALGVLAQFCWSRMLGLPLERPKSLTFDELKLLVDKNK